MSRSKAKIIRKPLCRRSEMKFKFFDNTAMAKAKRGDSLNELQAGVISPVVSNLEQIKEMMGNEE